MVERVVSDPSPHYARLREFALRAVDFRGYLTCPAPASDPTGTYRVIKEDGQLKIVRLDDTSSQGSPSTL